MSATATDTAGSAPPREARPRLLERLGDRLNPLVVKEVRQGIRSRVFWASFGLMLLACLILSMVAYASSQDSGLSTQGKDFFFAFFICLGVVHFFIIPYSAYRSLAREREDETWVLLILTGLGPRRILLGKVASFLVQAGLYASAVGPFLLFSYYLNGIDLPTILIVLGLGASWLLFLTVVAVAAATLADARMGRALVHLVLLAGLLLSLVYGLMSAFVLSEQGYRFLTRDKEFVVFACSFLWAMLTYGWLLFETAAARLSLSTENYTFGARLALALQMLLSGVVLAGLWMVKNLSTDMATVSSILGCLHLSVTGIFVATDVDGQARALRAATRPWSLLRPGAVRGFRLVTLLLLFWAGVCFALYSLSLDRITSGAHLLGLLAAPAYALLFLSLPLLVGRLPRSDRLASPAVVRVLFFALAGLAGALPPLVAVLLGQHADDPLFNLLNPFVGMANFSDYDYSTNESKMSLGLLACVWLVAVLTTFAADRTLVERERRAHAS
ncbi:ABC transporter permease [Vitiosangium sp. GDMCC 1.1324]|uniref:ABC transporter permease n=1 Tax=Vitiosangium sp. (strain GDMCC 1.1324) TaxID=2138576 RepID=UPI000D38CF55|nr:ABC transporter permease [Vitiosangium sp. GDMCC 1.1324]PTL81210.1 ABC transporter permease [Vitiosangium sp. GDMCC 1.1324]